MPAEVSLTTHVLDGKRFDIRQGEVQPDSGHRWYTLLTNGSIPQDVEVWTVNGITAVRRMCLGANVETMGAFTNDTDAIYANVLRFGVIY